ncbi:MAG: ribosome recycling factor [Bacteroidales bacterium]|nr:ribosome recycling factor [Bacteroidales bacterium]
MVPQIKELIDAAEVKMKEAVSYLEEDLKTYRVGKANPNVLAKVMVDYYGSLTPIQQVAAVTTPDAKTIAVQPWEKKMIPLIEKAIIDANVGLTPSNNGETIRCAVPPLTEERRKELQKKCKAAGENAKVSVRNARRDALEAAKKKVKADSLPEDTTKEAEDEMQKITDKNVKLIDELVAAKDKEIMTV